MSTEDGSYALTRIHGAFYGQMHLVVSKAGYTAADRVVEAKQQNNIDVSLTPVASSEVSKLSRALVGKQITVRGKLLVGKPGACVVLDNQQEVCVLEMRPKGVSEDPFDGMYDKLVEATGILRFHHDTAPVTKDLNVQRVPDLYYFEQETTRLQLVTH